MTSDGTLAVPIRAIPGALGLDDDGSDGEVLLSTSSGPVAPAPAGGLFRLEMGTCRVLRVSRLGRGSLEASCCLGASALLCCTGKPEWTFVGDARSRGGRLSFCLCSDSIHRMAYQMSSTRLKSVVSLLVALAPSPCDDDRLFACSFSAVACRNLGSTLISMSVSLSNAT